MNLLGADAFGSEQSPAAEGASRAAMFVAQPSNSGLGLRSQVSNLLSRVASASGEFVPPPRGAPPQPPPGPHHRDSYPLPSPAPGETSHGAETEHPGGVAHLPAAAALALGEEVSPAHQSGPSVAPVSLALAVGTCRATDQRHGKRGEGGTAAGVRIQGTVARARSPDGPPSVRRRA